MKTTRENEEAKKLKPILIILVFVLTCVILQSINILIPSLLCGYFLGVRDIIETSLSLCVAIGFFSALIVVAKSKQWHDFKINLLLSMGIMFVITICMSLYELYK